MTEQILDALAALRSETRKQMILELEAARTDTTEEFAKAMTIGIKAKLAGELKSIECLLVSIQTVSAEYAEIHRSTIPK